MNSVIRVGVYLTSSNEAKNYSAKYYIALDDNPEFTEEVCRFAVKYVDGFVDSYLATHVDAGFDDAVSVLMSMCPPWIEVSIQE